MFARALVFLSFLCFLLLFYCYDSSFISLFVVTTTATTAPREHPKVKVWSSGLKHHHIIEKPTSSQHVFEHMCPTQQLSSNNERCHHTLSNLRPIISSYNSRTIQDQHCSTTMLFDVGIPISYGAPHLSHLYQNSHKVKLPICITPNNEVKEEAEVVQQTTAQLSFIVQLLTEKNVGRGFVLDIGAGIGLSTITAAVLGYRVVAFESHRRLGDLLSRSVFMNQFQSSVTIFENSISNDVVCLTTLVPYLEVLAVADNLPKVVVLLRISPQVLAPLVLSGGGEFFQQFTVQTIILEVSKTEWSDIAHCPPTKVASALFELNYVMSSQDGSLISNTDEFQRWIESESGFKNKMNVVFTIDGSTPTV